MASLSWGGWRLASGEQSICGRRLDVGAEIQAIWMKQWLVRIPMQKAMQQCQCIHEATTITHTRNILNNLSHVGRVPGRCHFIQAQISLRLECDGQEEHVLKISNSPMVMNGCSRPARQKADGERRCSASFTSKAQQQDD